MAMNQTGLNTAGQYQSGYLGPSNAIEAPRTIASAAGRIDSLNDRLGKASEALSMISAQIGAVSPVGKVVGGDNSPTAASGAVYRLNDAADAAHNRVSEIENLIGGITRALG